MIKKQHLEKGNVRDVRRHGIVYGYGRALYDRQPYKT
jgi:hypothetical protein